MPNIAPALVNNNRASAQNDSSSERWRITEGMREKYRIVTMHGKRMPKHEFMRVNDMHVLVHSAARSDALIYSTQPA